MKGFFFKVTIWDFGLIGISWGARFEGQLQRNNDGQERKMWKDFIMCIFETITEKTKNMRRKIEKCKHQRFLLCL